jgi:hypothetical protein
VTSFADDRDALVGGHYKSQAGAEREHFLRNVGVPSGRSSPEMMSQFAFHTAR